MTLTEILDLLKVNKGPINGNYECACPVCDRGQNTYHLQVSDGNKGIIFRCAHAIRGGKQDKGHVEDICRELGITMKDLFHEDSRGDSAPKRGRPRKVEAAPVIRPKEPEPAKRLEVTYVYTDANGAERFRVERYRYDNGDKTFRQYYLDENGKRVNRVSEERYADIIYRLPDVMAAIRKGAPVFIVEGEKDADNLAALGYAATCNPCGTGRGWRDEYSHWLTGADVVVLADNDPKTDKDGKPHLKGQKHAKSVADSVRKCASSVKLCDTLQEYCDDLPSKGDISDLIEIEGRDARNVINRIARETPEYDPTMLRWWESAMDKVAALFDEIKPYAVVEGKIVKMTDKGISPLSNFVAYPTAIITKDDGQTKKAEFEVTGWDIHGAKLPTVRVSGREFDSMNWVREYWDLRANIYPGNMIRQNLSFVMSEVGAKVSKRWTEYTHTGWTRISGKWCYLYHGGAIGAEGVSVQLEDKLKMYTFDNSAVGYEDISAYEGIACTLGILDVIPQRISIPLLGTTFLAPLRTFFEMTGIKPRYALWLLGGTQTKKTTCSTLALAHYGSDFDNGAIPASFRDTANSILKKAFILKDMPILVDDFHPQSSVQERRKMTDTAQALSRAFGDGASRGRMGSDLSLRESQPPRGVAIMSGEDLPDVGESGLARYYIVNFFKKDIDLDDPAKRKALTDLQRRARQGYLQKTMIGYIEWLAAQADALPARLEREFMENREKAMTMMKGQFARAPETIAMIMTAYEMMLNYMRDYGFLTDADVGKMTDEAWDAVVKNARRQSRELHEDRPSAMFTSAIQNLLLTGQATVMPIGGGAPDEKKAQTMVGYTDTDYYYFLPDMVYKQVHDLYQREGMEFPLTKKMLWKQLKEDKVIAASDTGVNTKTKRIGDRTVRTLCVARAKIDADGDVQTEMVFEELPESAIPKGM